LPVTGTILHRVDADINNRVARQTGGAQLSHVLVSLCSPAYLHLSMQFIIYETTKKLIPLEQIWKKIFFKIIFGENRLPLKYFQLTAKSGKGWRKGHP
jgi:hypothetical protein